MRGKQAFPIAVVLIALAVAVAILVFWPVQKALVVEGTLIDAGNEDPHAIFAGLSEKSLFLISPQMNERAKDVDHEIFNGTALFLQVLEGNSRKAVQVIRVYSETNELSHCLSNYGDVNRSESLERDECLRYLSQENAVVVLIQFPDEKLSQPVLLIGEDQLTVRPKSNSDIGKTCFLALRILFENSRQIVQRSNTVLGNLLG